MSMSSYGQLSKKEPIMKKSIKVLASLAAVFAAVTLAACGASKDDSSK